MIALLAPFLATTPFPAASAHPLAPAALDLSLSDPITATWRTPAVRPTGVSLTPRLSPPCTPLSGPTPVPSADGWIETRYTYRCEGGLQGRTVHIDGLAAAPVDVVLTLHHPDGRTERTLLTAARPAAALEAPRGTIAAFFVLGVAHLAGGPDHLLLVIGLVVAFGPTRRLVRAVTAFTIGHSAALALSAAGLAPAAAPAVEVAIAASLVGLALELLREADAPGTGWLATRPVAVCVAVGLLHGAGLAGGLSAAGLPPATVLRALVGFNAGVEVAQLAVIAAVGVAWACAPSLRRIGRTIPAYGLGAVSAAWVIERVGVWAGVW